MNATQIGPLGLILSYLLLVIPVSIALWVGVRLLRDLAIALLRMTLQLLFVGFYLQVVFHLDSLLLNMAWLSVMVVVADLSIIRRCRLRLRPFVLPVGLAIMLGTTVPLAYFLILVLRLPNPTQAQYLIPIAGMILGNCLRANIVGIEHFTDRIRVGEKSYLWALAQGASKAEAVQPFLAGAVRASLAPTIATMATIGLVSLPGMMTGIILGGTDPRTAIEYQIAIMIAIFTGTAITVILAIGFSMKTIFSAYGVLNHRIFASARPVPKKG